MRNPRPWFRASKKAWYVEHRFKKIRLGEHPEGFPQPKKSKSGWNAPPPIMEAFYKLMASDPAQLPKPEKLVVAVLCDLFLDYSQKHHAPGTYDGYKHFLQSFCQVCGPRLAAELKPIHLTRWVDGNPSWDSARRHAVLAVKRAFSWADQQGVFSPNPLRSLTPEPIRKRTRVLTKNELDEILSAIPDQQFKEFLQAMLETGCRPSEVARVQAENVNLELGVWIFEDHKTVKKTGKPRIVYLTPNMVELSRKLMGENPQGPLFRGPRGKKPLTRNGIRCRFRVLREKLPHLKHFVCYNLRHTFATNALVKGVGIAQVAELLGHTSTEMVSQTYGHLADQITHMREAAKKATS